MRTSRVTDVLNMPYQSDRLYPPYLWASSEYRLAMDWGRGGQRAERETPPNTVAFVSDSARRGAISPRTAVLLAQRQAGLLDERVLTREWTLQPDILEQRRAKVRFTFRPVNTSLALGGGAIELRPIDGEGSEGAIIAFFPAERFLYAGDYIQGGGPDNFAVTYAREVAAAVNRAAFAPERFAAMHLPLNDWSSLSRFTGQP